MRDPKGMGEGNLYCLTSQRVERWERMGEDVAVSLDRKGRRGALLALQSTGFASSQTSQLQASQVRGWQVRSSRRVYEGKEGNAASFYTNFHNPADVALATSHSELAGFRRFRRFWGFAVFAVRSLQFCRIRKVRSRRVRNRRQRFVRCQVTD